MLKHMKPAGRSAMVLVACPALVASAASCHSPALGDVPATPGGGAPSPATSIPAPPSAM